MSENLTQVLAGGALAIVILDRVFTLIKPLLHREPIHKTTAGSKDENFWIVTIGHICKDSVIPLVDMMRRIERNQVEILRILADIRFDQKRKDD